MPIAGPEHSGPGLGPPVHATVEIIKGECWKYLGSLIPIPLVLSIIAYFDASLRPGAIALAGVAVAGIGTTAMPLMCDDKAVLDAWIRTCIFNMVGRTAAHLVVAAWHSDSLIFRVFTIVLAPVATTRQAHSMRAFRAFLVAHLAIVLWRFAGTLWEDWPWLLCAVAAAHIQRLIVENRIEQRWLVQKVDAQKRHTVEVAEKMMTNMLQTYCDATVIMGPDMTILEDPSGLEVLMKRKNMRGRNFAEFIEPSDLDAFRKHVDDLLAELQRGASAGPSSTPSGEEGARNSWYLHSCQLRLIDSYAVLFEVTLSSVCMRNSRGRPLVLVGVSEMADKKEKKPSKPRQRKPIYRMNFETGNLESMVSSFTEGDVEVVKSAKTLALERRKSATVAELETLDCGAPLMRRLSGC